MAVYWCNAVISIALAVVCSACFVDAVPVRGLVFAFNAAELNTTTLVRGKREIMVRKISTTVPMPHSSPVRLNMPTPRGTVTANFLLAPVASEWL